MHFIKLLSMFLALSCVSACSKSKQPSTPPTVVQGSVLPQGWYTKDPQALNLELEQYLALAEQHFGIEGNESTVRGLICPHAGYFYSGLCAASAYQALLMGTPDQPLHERKNTRINKVVVLCPAHTMFYHGVALPQYTVCRTALGDIPVDWNTMYKLSKSKQFQFDERPFEKEHAIEIQLPFLQKTIADFQLIPLIVGHLKNDEPLLVAKELAKVIDANTLVVVSSDFVHYGKSYEYEPCTSNINATVRMIDSNATQAISRQSYEKFYDLLSQTEATICGQYPLKVLMCLTRLTNFGMIDTQTASYYTSAHMLAARNEQGTIDIPKLMQELPDSAMQTSVSYLGSVLRSKTNALPTLTMYERKSLFSWIRKTLTYRLKGNQEVIPLPLISAGLEQQCGVFVTLKKNDALRGCIGRVTSDAPLYATAQEMAIAAATNDSRFSPVRAKELDEIRIEISLLSDAKLAMGPQNIVLGKHGIIMHKLDPITQKPTHHALFLPQVLLEQGWNLTTTLEQLCLKAGIDKNAWQEDCQFYLFEGTKIIE